MYWIETFVHNESPSQERCPSVLLPRTEFHIPYSKSTPSRTFPRPLFRTLHLSTSVPHGPGRAVLLFRLSKEASRLESEVSSAQRVLRKSPYTVDSLRAEAEATRRLLSERATKLPLLANEEQHGQTEQEQGTASAAGSKDGGGPASAVSSSDEENNGPDMEVAEGSEVEGAFDPTPEIKSRFADKSSSLRFVTPEEEKKKRREEMAAVFAGRDEATAAEAAEHGSGGGSDGGGSRPEGPAAAEGAEKASELVHSEHTNGLTKALGSALEKKLGPSFFVRAPPPGSAAACAGRVMGTKRRVARIPQKQQPHRSKKKAAAIPTPRFEPKSKLFRSLLTPPRAAGAAGRSACPPPPPPPLPSVAGGLLEQIRTKGGGRGAVPPPPPMPMPLPASPALPLPQRSLFATAGGPSTTAATVQGAPDGMFAELKAKTAARQALRRAAEAEAEAKAGGN